MIQYNLKQRRKWQEIIERNIRLLYNGNTIIIVREIITTKNDE